MTRTPLVKTEDAIKTARMLLGTLYSEMDCINLIKAIIRRSPGGVPDYTTAGTNALWNSYESSRKYRDLLERQRGIDGAQAGMLTFKIRKRTDGSEDVHHVGLVTGEGTVIHSSGPTGKYKKVVETDLDNSWDALAIHRYIQPETSDKKKERNTMDENFFQGRAIVTTQEDPLTVRTEPITGRKIGSVERGSVVDVLDIAEGNGWLKIQQGEVLGWACGDYLRIEKEADEEGAVTSFREKKTGQMITILGDWTRMED